MNCCTWIATLSQINWQRGRGCDCPSSHDNLCEYRFNGQCGELPKGYDHKHVYDHIGLNINITGRQAAIGCTQPYKFPGFVEQCRHNFDRILAGLVGFVFC